jgi:PAS domain S-box-containing protein
MEHSIGSGNRNNTGDLPPAVPVPLEPDKKTGLAEKSDRNQLDRCRSVGELSRSNIWLDTILQSVGEGIITIDKNHLITSFNEGAMKISGWSSAEVLKQHINNVFRVGGDEDGFIETISALGGKCQVKVVTRWGKECILKVSSTQFVNPIDDDKQVALVLCDITEEMATEQLKSYFLANISHEFRTPLSAINASVELLLEEIDHLSTAEMSELLNSIHLGVTGLQTLIDNLLESASIEAGKFHLRRRRTDLNKLVNEAIHVVEPLMARRRQTLMLHMNIDILEVTVDPTRFIQVLVNLLSNASKYSPMGKEIDLRIQPVNGSCLRIEVADRGPGIPPNERENLFRRFMRLGDQNEAQYGAGLGLSVVKTIIEGHIGEVGVKDRAGGGSIFWFTIPLFNGDFNESVNC